MSACKYLCAYHLGIDTSQALWRPFLLLLLEGFCTKDGRHEGTLVLKLVNWQYSIHPFHERDIFSLLLYDLLDLEYFQLVEETRSIPSLSLAIDHQRRIHSSLKYARLFLPV